MKRIFSSLTTSLLLPHVFIFSVQMLFDSIFQCNSGSENAPLYLSQSLLAPSCASPPLIGGAKPSCNSFPFQRAQNPSPLFTSHQLLCWVSTSLPSRCPLGIRLRVAPYCTAYSKWTHDFNMEDGTLKNLQERQITDSWEM